MIKLTLTPEGTVSGEGFTPMQNLIATHRYKCGWHLTAMKAIYDAGEVALRKKEIEEHAKEVNRRHAILSGLLFGLGVEMDEDDFEALKESLDIDDAEMNEMAENATDVKPGYGEGGFAV